MSEQAKVGFTKGVDEGTYVAGEVDVYIAMLHTAYEEMEKELKAVEDKSAKEQKEAPDIEEMKRLYEDQMKQLKDKADSEKEAKHKAKREKDNLQAKLDEKLKVIEELKGEAKEKLKVIEELKEEAKEIGRVSAVEGYYEEKVKDLEVIVNQGKENRQKLQETRDVLEETKKQLEEEQFKNTRDGRVKIYNELFERTIDTVESYVNDTKEQTEHLISETQKKQDEVLRRANLQSFNIVKEAKQKASDMLKQAQGKSQDVLNKAQNEYIKIRELIKEASVEYVELTTSRHETEIIDISKEKLEDVEALEKEGIKGKEE